mmetsp:Transcript_25578/g.29271  ORF Transcript_25578/g.29271 Transcript_25578/m.29271 type:complete len:393 (-) Transcript_25578:335-1513(-)
MSSQKYCIQLLILVSLVFQLTAIREKPHDKPQWNFNPPSKISSTPLLTYRHDEESNKISYEVLYQDPTIDEPLLTAPWGVTSNHRSSTKAEDKPTPSTPTSTTTFTDSPRFLSIKSTTTTKQTSTPTTKITTMGKRGETKFIFTDNEDRQVYTIETPQLPPMINDNNIRITIVDNHKIHIEVSFSEKISMLVDKQLPYWDHRVPYDYETWVELLNDVIPDTLPLIKKEKKVDGAWVIDVTLNKASLATYTPLVNEYSVEEKQVPDQRHIVYALDSTPSDVRIEGIVGEVTDPERQQIAPDGSVVSPEDEQAVIADTDSLSEISEEDLAKAAAAGGTELVAQLSNMDGNDPNSIMSTINALPSKEESMDEAQDQADAFMDADSDSDDKDSKSF